MRTGCEEVKNRGITNTRSSHLPWVCDRAPSSSLSLFHFSPCCREDGWPWLLGWQRNHCGAVLVELAGNAPSRMLRKTVYEEVSPWRHSATKLPERDASTSCWRLGGADRRSSRNQLREEVPMLQEVGAEVPVCLEEFAARPHQNQERKVLPVMSLRHALLTKLRIVPAGKRKKKKI